MKKVIFFICLFFVLTIDVSALKIEERWAHSQSPNEVNENLDFVSFKQVQYTDNNIIAIGGGPGGSNSRNPYKGEIISIYDKEGNLESTQYIGDYDDYKTKNNKLLFTKINSSSVEESYIYSMDTSQNIEIVGKTTISTKEKIKFIGDRIYIFKYISDDGIIQITEVDDNFNKIKTYEKDIESSICEEECSTYGYSIVNNSIYFFKKEYNDDDTTYNIVVNKFDSETNEFSLETELLGLKSENKIERFLDGGLFLDIVATDWSGTIDEDYQSVILYSLKNPELKYELDKTFSIKGNYYDGEYYYISGYDIDGAVLYKFDENLNKIFEYRTNEENTSFKSFTIIDNYIYAILQVESLDNGLNWHREGNEHTNSIVVINTNGEKKYEYSIENDNLNNSEFHTIIESEHGFLLAGEQVISSSDVHGVIAEYTIIHDIETKTDGNGTVEADHIEAEGGAAIKFTVTPKEGYVLSVVKVTDSNGNVVTFTDYTFTMPNANVLIEATFVPIPEDNPETSDILAIVCTIFVISGILLTYVNYKKNNIV